MLPVGEIFVISLVLMMPIFGHLWTNLNNVKNGSFFWDLDKTKNETNI